MDKFAGSYWAGSFFLLILGWTRRAGLLASVHRADPHSFGAVLFPASLALCALLYWPLDHQIFQGAALILGLSDGLAGLIGSRFGRYPYRLTGLKTIEGSASFFLITWLILLGLSRSQPGLTLNAVALAFVSALGLTIVEGLFSRGWDNLAIPLVAGGMIYYLLI